MFIHIYIYVCVFIFMFVYVCACGHVCLCTCVCVWLFAHVPLYLLVYLGTGLVCSCIKLKCWPTNCFCSLIMRSVGTVMALMT